LRESKNHPEAVGTAFSMSPVHPETGSLEDRTAAERWHRFCNMWFLDPVMHGKYPEAYLHGSVEDHVEIRAGDMDLIKAPLDFIGINLYTRTVVTHDSHDRYMGVKRVKAGGEEVTDFGWEVYPLALSEMIMRVSKDYHGVPIYVTENGCSYGDGPGADGKVNDQRRVSFLRRFIGEVGRAMKAGADVRGYFLWTFTDNFEWAEGFGQRFGIVHCDFKTQQRIVKESGHWYSRLARTGALDFDPVV
jgi:beta-glucosidase